MRNLDSKFSIDGDRVVNTVSGQAIPEDEPVFLFRARDMLGLQTLVVYEGLCRMNGCEPSHLAGVAGAIARFEKFMNEHPDRMKMPGITRETPEALSDASA